VRLSRPTMTALCAALVLAILPSTAAVAADPQPGSAAEPVPLTPEPSVLVGESPSAEEALAAVVAAFRPDAASRPRATGGAASPFGGDLTMAMLALARQIDQLSPADQRLAERYLARPTDGANDPQQFGYLPAAQRKHRCGPHVCVTWVSSTTDAPRPGDVDKDGVPNQVENTQDVMASVWHRIVTRGKYKSPVRDRGLQHREGPNRKFDVYLADIGAWGYYGYCATEPRSPRGQGYCVLDNDYRAAQFPTNTRLENLQVTAAHEFFHAVQFAYDVNEDLWFMEGTAAWIEDELYDDVDDNRQYLAQSPLSRPDVPLDFVSGTWLPYGSWIFWRFLTERFPQRHGTGLPVIMRRIWDRADDSRPAAPGTYSLKALSAVLAARGTSFSRLYAGFAEANRHPGDPSHRHYEEGGAYRRAPLLRSFRLSAGERATTWQSVALRQLSSRTVAFTPGPGVGADSWRIRVRVDAPPPRRGSVAQLSVYRQDGAVETRAVKLDATGVGAGKARFFPGEVVRVELSLVNASTRYKCNRGTNASCGGVGRDNGLQTQFRAQLFQQ
jgi:hypothetical protein